MSEHFLTLSPKNLFRFTCPVFNAEVQMRGCVLVRDKVYKGERFEQRKGCQACISASKCPAAQIIQKMALSRGDANDHCSSREEKTGKLPLESLERIRRVLVPDHVMRQYGLSNAEIDLINTSGGRIDQQIATAPQARVSGRVQTSWATEAPKKRQKPPAAAPAALSTIATSTVQAATSGDMAAAIN